MNNTIVGFLLVAIIAVINGAPQYTWEDLSKNVKTLPTEARQTEMTFNRRMNHHSEPSSHESHQRMKMTSSSDSELSNDRKHQKTLRILSSSNDSGNSDSRSMEYYRPGHVRADEDVVVPMIHEDTRSMKHDVHQNVMDFLSGQQNFDEQAVRQEDSKKYLTKTILEDLPRHGIQSNYYGSEHGPRFMNFAPKMEQMQRAVQPLRVPVEDSTMYMDMGKKIVRMTSDLMDATHHSMKNKRNSQGHEMDSMSMMSPTNFEQNRMTMTTSNMEEPTESNVSNRNSHEQSQHQRHQNTMVENEMRSRNQKLTMTHNGQENNEQMMNTIYRN